MHSEEADSILSIIMQYKTKARHEFKINKMASIQINTPKMCIRFSMMYCAYVKMLAVGTGFNGVPRLNQYNVRKMSQNHT